MANTDDQADFSNAADNDSSQSDRMPFASAPALYGSGVRSQVFEVIVRQAMAGAPWEEICAGPMQVNHITQAEVIEEVRKRRGGEDPPTAGIPRYPLPSEGSGSVALALPLPPVSDDDEPKTGWL